MNRFKGKGQIYKYGTYITPSELHQVGYNWKGKKLYQLIEARTMARIWCMMCSMS